jgi:hypothetical protein
MKAIKKTKTVHVPAHDREDTHHHCPVCDGICKHIDDTRGGPMSSGWSWWACGSCFWTELLDEETVQEMIIRRAVKNQGFNQDTPRDQVIAILSGIHGHLENALNGHVSRTKFYDVRLPESLGQLESVFKLLRGWPDLDTWKK